MANAQAFAFDAYGTLFDVHSVVVALQGLTGDAESVSTLWRAKQLEYSWLRSLMGRYVDFWTVTDEALQFALNRFGIEVTPAQHAAMLDAYLHLSAYPEIHATLAALVPRPCLMLSNGAPRMLEAAVTSSGLAGKFTHIFSADQVKVYKPDPRVYALVPDALRTAEGGHRFRFIELLRCHGGKDVWFSGGVGESHARASRHIRDRAGLRVVASG